MGTVLVTGGAGFIGSHLVRRLVADGRTVRVLDALVEQVHGPNPLPNLPTEVEFIHGDVADDGVWERTLDGVTTLYHLAAEVGVGQSMYEIERYVRANTWGTARLLQYLVEKRPALHRVVVASSMSIYGEGSYRCGACGSQAPGQRPESRLKERKWEVPCPVCGADMEPIPTPETKGLLPTSIYAIGKRDQEEMVLSVCGAYGIPAVACRFFNVYGSGQALSNPYTGVLAIFSARLMNDHPPLLFEDGEQQRDFIHVEDLVEGLLLAESSDKAAGHAINLGTGTPTTVRQVAETLGLLLGKSDIRPEAVGRFRTGDIRHCIADTSRAKGLLGFKARIPFREGVGRLVEWVRTQSPDDKVESALKELESHRLTL